MEAKHWDAFADQKSYFDRVHSPFGDPTTKRRFMRLVMPFFDRRKDTIDLGTGIGNLIPHLAESFKSVTAVDFSPEMVDFCRSHHQASNLSLDVADIRNLRRFYGSFDVAFAVNSMLGPTRSDLRRQFAEAFRTLRENGTLIAVLPSMESEIHVAMRVFEEHMRRHHDERAARAEAAAVIGKHRLDFMLGRFRSSQGDQKWCYRFEVMDLLAEVGFASTSIDRLRYPWSSLPNVEMGFARHPGPWDWFVVAKR
ncbi:MAG: class I SAM-dependent methyltransferase [Nanoarchaeota archaeon]